MNVLSTYKGKLWFIRLSQDKTVEWEKYLVCESCEQGPVTVHDFFCRFCGVEFDAITTGA